MDNTIETFEIYSKHNDNNVCRMDPMLFLVSIMMTVLILYIIQFKIQ
jgi:hypothetical protein